MKDKRIYFKKTSGNKRLESESLVVSKVYIIIEVTLNYGTDVLVPEVGLEPTRALLLNGF